MADLTYTVGVETSQAQRNLTSLQQNLGKLTTSFGGLKTAVASIGFTSLLSSALSYADAISDVATASNVAVGTVLAFGKAVQANGGEVDSAQKGLLKLVQTIDDAAQGSAKAQDAFNEIGISLNDLATLSEEDLLKRTIDGLSKIDSNSKRLGLTVDLLGKSFRGVDIRGVGAGFAQASIDSQQYAASIAKAAAVQDKLEKTIGDFKIALLSAIEPLLDMVSGLNSSIEVIKNVVKFLLIIAAAAASLFVFGRVIAAIASGLATLGLAAETVSSVFLNLSLRFTTVSRVGALFSDAMAWVGVQLGRLVTIFPAVGEWIAYIGTKMQSVVVVFTAAATAAALYWKELKNFAGFSDKAAEADRRLQEAMKNSTHGQRSEEIKKQGAAQREVIDATAKQVKAIGELGKAYQLQNKAAIETINAETQLLGKSDYAIAMKRAELDITAKNKAEVDKLTQAKIAYLNSTENASPKVIAAYDNEIKKVKEGLAADIQRVQVATDGYQQRIMVLDQFAARLEEVNQMEEYATKQGEALTESYKSVVKPLQEANKTIEKRYDLEKSMRGMNDYQIETGNQIFDIEEKRNQALKEIRDNTLLTVDAQKMMSDEVVAGYDKQIAMTKRNRDEQYKYSREFSTGWNKAFNDYVSQATNAANLASQQFGAFTNFVDSAINQLVDNGKISFKSLVDSLIKELLKAELKNAIGSVAAAMGGIGKAAGGAGAAASGGGIGDFLSTAWDFGKGLLGFANGGNPPVNKPSIVGERGPEMFIPKTAGTIIPNGGGAVNNTYNTYNISAIDSKSVAQMFSENRRALLGTVQAAQKELPYRAR